MSVIPSVAVLGLVALVALWLAIRRPSAPGLRTERAAVSRMLAVTTAIQAGHFAEEWATDFHSRFPELFGLEAMPLTFFLGFNFAWIAAWTVSVPLLKSGRKAAFFAAWFLALAGIINGVAHPLMVLASGGYFPGLISSPLIGLASIFLWQRLRSATAGTAP